MIGKLWFKTPVEGKIDFLTYFRKPATDSTKGEDFSLSLIVPLLI